MSLLSDGFAIAFVVVVALTLGILVAAALRKSRLLTLLGIPLVVVAAPLVLTALVQPSAAGDLGKQEAVYVSLLLPAALVTTVFACLRRFRLPARAGASALASLALWAFLYPELPFALVCSWSGDCL